MAKAKQAVRTPSPANGNRKSAGAAASKRPLRVLLVTPVYPPLVSVGGGVAITYGALYDKLTARGHDVDVISPRLGNVDHGETNLYAGQPVMLTTISNLRLWWREFSSHDVVVCPDNTQLPFLIYFAHLTHTPLLSNLHTNFRMVLEGGSWAARHLAAPIMDNSLKMLSWVTPRSMTTSPSYMEVLQSRGFRVGGVFSPRIKLGIFENNKATDEEVAEARAWLIGKEVNFKVRSVLLFVGRWSHEKRIDLLPNALPAGCLLAVVGDGPKSQAKKIEKIHDPSKGVVVHRGIVDQSRLAVLYRACDFLVSASAFETLGMTVAEANMCGTPVIVQNASGFVSQVVEGQNGFLVDFAAPDIRATVDQCIINRPSKALVFSTIAKRWDSKMPNLEDVVEETARMRKNDWDCIKPPMPLFTLFIIVYFFAYRIMSWPFVFFKGYNHYKKADPSNSTGKKLM